MSDMMLKTPTAMDEEIGSPKREPKSGDSGCLAQEIMGGQAVILPTPNAVEAEKYTKTYNKDSQMGRSLTAMAVNGLLPTPHAVSVRHPGRVSAAKAQGSVSFRSRLNGEEAPTGLEDWLEFHGLMPSPVAQDYRRRGPNSRQQGLPEVCHRLLHNPIADGQRPGADARGGFEEMLPENAKSQGSKDGRTSQLNPLFVGEMMGYPLEWLISPFLSGDGEGRP